MYDNPKCKIWNKAFFSGTILQVRELKQRRPLTADLFMIAVEFLAQKSTMNNKIGLRINGLESQISMYADWNDVHFLCSVASLTNNFSVISRLKPNYKWMYYYELDLVVF